MKKVALLDGGMGQELIRRSAHNPHPMWSARVLLDEPDIVEAVHRDYIDAGARIITLNTYSATPERLAQYASADLFEPLQQRAIEAAQRARDKSPARGEGVELAGCLSPLFGSYHPENAPAFEDCLDRYRMIASQQAAAVDLFICETMSSIKEGKAAAMAAIETGRPTWLSFTLEDSDAARLRSGELLSDAITAISEIRVEALLLNCSIPEAIDSAFDTLQESAWPTGAYANGFSSVSGLQIGDTVDQLKARNDLGPVRYSDFAMGWVEAGAQIVGGCCEVGPAHIAHLSGRLRDSGYEISGALDMCAA